MIRVANAWKCLTSAALLLSASMFPALAEDAPKSYDTGMIPSPRIMLPKEKAAALVVLLSDAAGWTDKEQAIADTLTDDKTVVIGIDLKAYLASLAKDDGDCIYMVSDIESLSQQVQRAVGTDAYQLPVVAGVGAGGALALAIAAQTPPATIGQTLAVDPEEGIALEKQLCTPAEKVKKGDRLVYGLTDGVSGRRFAGLERCHALARRNALADMAGRSHYGDRRRQPRQIRFLSDRGGPGRPSHVPHQLGRDGPQLFAASGPHPWGLEPSGRPCTSLTLCAGSFPPGIRRSGGDHSRHRRVL